jgi:hypothetical protein
MIDRAFSSDTSIYSHHPLPPPYKGGEFHIPLFSEEGVRGWWGATPNHLAKRRR